MIEKALAKYNTNPKNSWMIGDKKRDLVYSLTCLDCFSKSKREYYLKNKEALILKAKIWKSNNKESVKISGKKAREKNKDYERERSKKYQREER